MDVNTAGGGRGAETAVPDGDEKDWPPASVAGQGRPPSGLCTQPVGAPPCRRGTYAQAAAATQPRVRGRGGSRVAEKWLDGGGRGTVAAGAERRDGRGGGELFSRLRSQRGGGLAAAYAAAAYAAERHTRHWAAGNGGPGEGVGRGGGEERRRVKPHPAEEGVRLSRGWAHACAPPARASRGGPKAFELVKSGGVAPAAASGRTPGAGARRADRGGGRERTSADPPRARI